MSASTPEKPKTRNGGDSGVEPIARRDGTSVWWGISAALHAAVLLAILFFTPLREIVFSARQPKQFDATAIRLAVVAHIRHKYTDYDRLLARYDDKQEARWAVQGRIQEILDEWEHPA